MQEITFEKLPQAVGQLLDKLDNIERLLEEKQKEAAPETDKLLTVEEAATFLHLEPPTIYGKVQNRTIPFCKQGKRLYFSKQELSDWIKQGRKKTTVEIAAEADQCMIPKRRRQS